MQCLSVDRNNKMKRGNGMKKLLCMLLCVLLLAVAPVGCAQAEKAPALPELPVDGLVWGMTLEEAKAALVKKGLPEGEIVLNNDERQILLSAEQCEALGLTEIADFAIGGASKIALWLVFSPDEQGEKYLCLAHADVTAESKEAVAEKLEKQYGKSETDAGWWNVGEGFVNLSSGSANTEVTIEYHAEKYVKANFGKF